MEVELSLLGEETGSYSSATSEAAWLADDASMDIVEDAELGCVSRLRNTFYKLGTNIWTFWVCLVVGAGFMFFVPYHLVSYHPRHWILLGIFCTCLYILLAYLGHKFQRTKLLRESRPRVWIQTGLAIPVGATIILLGDWTGSSMRYINGFAFLGVSVFCLVMIAHPSYDYGILSFFTSLPLQITAAHYKLQFNWRYIVLSIFPVWCLFCQFYFIRYVDEVYKTKKARKKKKEEESA